MFNGRRHRGAGSRLTPAVGRWKRPFAQTQAPRGPTVARFLMAISTRLRAISRSGLAVVPVARHIVTCVKTAIWDRSFVATTPGTK